MRTMLFGLLGVLPIAIGCGADDGTADDAPPGDILPTSSGRYLGAYLVPTPPELAAAATYVVDHIDWTVSAGIATLHYDLPVGLVGGELSISLSGPITPGDTTVTLTSANGTAVCEQAGAIVTCHEQFVALGALPLSMAVVEQRAAAEYAGPAIDRVNVAMLFDADPLGIATFDLTSPGLDDHGGNDSHLGDVE